MESEPSPQKPFSVVVDANIIISLLIAKGSKHKLFFSNKIEALSPDFILFEIGKYWGDIVKKSGLSEKELKAELFTVRLQLKTFSIHNIKDFLKEGARLSPDPDDSEYFALALKFNCPIWSEDKRLKKQSEVEVFHTKELLEKLELI